MADFIVDVLAEIDDFFINFWSDKIINKFASKKTKQATYKFDYRKLNGIKENLIKGS